MRLRSAIGAFGLSAFLAAAAFASRAPQSAPPATSPSAGSAPTPRPSPAAGPVEQAVLLEGKPFPPSRAVPFRLPEPKRTFHVSAGGEAGDGSERQPWGDLATALPRLSPGDRLRVRPGTYRGPVEIGDACQDGSERQPIQLVFDGRAVLEPAAGAPALVVSRAHWLIVGAYARLGAADDPGIVFRGRRAHDVRLEGARVSDGTGPGIRIEPEAARVTISGAYVAKTRLLKMGPSSFGIEVSAGTREVEIETSHLANNPAGSIRVRAPQPDERAARDLQIRGNSIRDDGATAIGVEAADGVTIAGNTLGDATGIEGTRGVALESVERASVRTNRLSGFSIGFAVGRAEPEGGAVHAANGVTVERNVVECSSPGTRDRRDAAAFVVEAGRDVRLLNNLADGCAQDVLLFGAPPQTERVTVANNIFIRVSDVALLMQSASSAKLFDWNVFSPSGPATAEVGGKAISLSQFLEGGSMPHTQLKPGLRILQRDAARISGLPTVDRGKAVEGLQFRGAAPDLGVAER